MLTETNQKKIKQNEYYDHSIENWFFANYEEKLLFMHMIISDHEIFMTEMYIITNCHLQKKDSVLTIKKKKEKNWLTKVIKH